MEMDFPFACPMLYQNHTFTGVGLRVAVRLYRSTSQARLQRATKTPATKTAQFSKDKTVPELSNEVLDFYESGD